MLVNTQTHKRKIDHKEKFNLKAVVTKQFMYTNKKKL